MPENVQIPMKRRAGFWDGYVIIISNSRQMKFGMKEIIKERTK
jgi:hypothetical protein